MIKKARVAAGADAFGAAFAEMQVAVDRAVSKHLMHRNTVARIKRRVNRFAKAKSAGAAAKV